VTYSVIVTEKMKPGYNNNNNLQICYDIKLLLFHN